MSLVGRILDAVAGVRLLVTTRSGATKPGEGLLYLDARTRTLRLATEDGDAAVGGAGGGGGTGDVTGPSASVDSEIAVYSGTTGKVIKRATTTGLLKGTSGVISAAVAGTDYQAADAQLDALAATAPTAGSIHTWTSATAASVLPAGTEGASLTIVSGAPAWVVLGVISAIRIGATPSTDTPLTGGDDYYDVGDEMTAFIDATVP